MLATSGLMDERDYRTYLELFRHMSNFMCKPNVIVYLDVPAELSDWRQRVLEEDEDAPPTGWTGDQ